MENVAVTCGETQERTKRDIRSLRSDNRSPEGQHIISTSVCSVFRDRRQVGGFRVGVAFEFVISNIFNPDQTAGEIEEMTLDQFDVIISHVTSIAQDGGLDIPGLEIDVESLLFEESEIVCEEGGVPEYSSFTCREYTPTKRSYLHSLLASFLRRHSILKQLCTLRCLCLLN